MTEQNDGGPAFPLPIAVGPAGDIYTAGEFESSMSLRDWFAGQALAGLSRNVDRMRVVSLEGDDPSAVISNTAYSIADAMLKAKKDAP